MREIAMQMAAREEAFYDAADDLSDLHSEASATRLASNTPHHHHASVRWLFCGFWNVPPCVQAVLITVRLQ